MSEVHSMGVPGNANQLEMIRRRRKIPPWNGLYSKEVRHWCALRPATGKTPCYLFDCRAQIRRLQKLGADTFERSLVWHGAVSFQPTEEACGSFNSRSACSQSSTSCPDSQPRLRYSS